MLLLSPNPPYDVYILKMHIIKYESRGSLKIFNLRVGFGPACTFGKGVASCLSIIGLKKYCFIRRWCGSAAFALIPATLESYTVISPQIA